MLVAEPNQPIVESDDFNPFSSKNNAYHEFIRKELITALLFIFVQTDNSAKTINGVSLKDCLTELPTLYFAK